jgi:Tol biopolymer transport system component
MTDRTGRWGIGLAALLVLAACTTSAKRDSTPPGGSPQAGPAAGRATSPSTAAPRGRPERILLRGRVAFAADRRGNVDIDLLDLPSGRLRRLTTSPAADLSPTWAPDGRRLAFRSDRDGNDEVYAMDADGSGQHNLTRNRAADYSPAWSPNGTRLASDCTLGKILPSGVGDFELCVVNVDGSGLRRITDAPGISAAGGWSGDGTRIVFASSRDQDPQGVSPCGDLFTVAADGSRLARLTDGPARDCQPSWSADGRHILFSSDRAHPGGDSDLYVMNPDGSAITRLTHAGAEEQEPTLSPCRGACQ